MPTLRELNERRNCKNKARLEARWLRIARPNKHRQPVIQAAQAQTTSYSASPSTGNPTTSNQLYKLPKHWRPVMQIALFLADPFIRNLYHIRSINIWGRRWCNFARRRTTPTTSVIRQKKLLRTIANDNFPDNSEGQLPMPLAKNSCQRQVPNAIVKSICQG